MSTDNGGNEFYAIMGILLFITLMIGVGVGYHNDHAPILSKKIIHKVDERNGNNVDTYYLFAADSSFLTVTITQYTFAKEGQIWQAPSFEWQKQ